MDRVTIYTDGACSGNPGPGGWACILVMGPHEKELMGHEDSTTNNRMELQAVISGLEALKRPCHVTVVTDSQYVRGGITEWMRTWEANGWRTSDRKPVKNKDLWLKLREVSKGHVFDWQWVKGHAGHPQNERCDELARNAVKKIGPGWDY